MAADCIFAPRRACSFFIWYFRSMVEWPVRAGDGRSHRLSHCLVFVRFLFRFCNRLSPCDGAMAYLRWWALILVGCRSWLGHGWFHGRLSGLCRPCWLVDARAVFAACVRSCIWMSVHVARYVYCRWCMHGQLETMTTLYIHKQTCW